LFQVQQHFGGQCAPRDSIVLLLILHLLLLQLRPAAARSRRRGRSPVPHAGPPRRRFDRRIAAAISTGRLLWAEGSIPLPVGVLTVQQQLWPPLSGARTAAWQLVHGTRACGGGGTATSDVAHRLLGRAAATAKLRPLFSPAWWQAQLGFQHPTPAEFCQCPWSWAPTKPGPVLKQS
jgi:hypothetical protein